MQFIYVYLLNWLFLCFLGCSQRLASRLWRSGRKEEVHIFRDRQTTRNLPIIYGPPLTQKNVA